MKNSFKIIHSKEKFIQNDYLNEKLIRKLSQMKRELKAQKVGLSEKIS
jgi:hypothetical protein